MNACAQNSSWGNTVASVLIGAALCSAPVANALPSYSGTTTGIFSAPVLSGNVILPDGSVMFVDNTASAVVSGVGTNAVNWGNHPTAVPNHSSLQFTGVNFANKAPDEIFKLGTLTLTNGTSQTSTLAFGVTFTLGVTNAGIPPIDPATAHVYFGTTINGNVDLFADADFVAFDILPVSFHVFEGATASADVFGAIHGDPFIVLTGLSLAPGAAGFLVPEPAIPALLAIGLAALGFARRRNKGPQEPT